MGFLVFLVDFSVMNVMVVVALEGVNVKKVIKVNVKNMLNDETSIENLNYLHLKDFETTLIEKL